MKLSFAFLAFLLFASCSSNTTPGTGSDNPNQGSSFESAHYLALSDSKTFTGHLAGSIKYLDTSGNITGIDQINQNSSETIGSLENHNGFLGRAIYDFPGGTQEVIGYIGSNSDTSDIIGFRQHTSGVQSLVAMPKNITVGQEWSPAPYPISCQIKLQDHLATFVASDGKSYSDVVELSASYFDSTFVEADYDVYLATVYKGNGILYFANGLGLVEVNIQNYEHLEYYNSQPFFNHPNYHQLASGIVTKN